VAAVFTAFSLNSGRQLVRLAEKATASAMLWPLALVVSHESQVSLRHGSAMVLALEQLASTTSCDTSWQAMLGKDEREATEQEIAALEAEHGRFQPADGEG
jgi:hypothetical protein